MDWVSGFVAPDPVAAAAFLFAEGAALLTLVLLMSTRLSALAAGVIGVALFGSAWLAASSGPWARLPYLAMRTVGRGGAVPASDRRPVARGDLLPRAAALRWCGSGRRHVGGDPFFASARPSWQYLAWAAIWLVLIRWAAW